MKIVIELTDVETKALSYTMADPQEWTENAIKERARQAIDDLVVKETERMMNDPSVESIPASVEEIVMSAG
jgi:hypothetical protein